MVKGFSLLKNDYSLFMNKSASDISISAVYVDDIILTRDNVAVIQDLKAHLHNVFNIKDLGELHFFLGIEVCHVSQGIILSQKKFTKELLQECLMDVYKQAQTALPAHIKLVNDAGDFYSDPTHYRCLVGKLDFLTHTRPYLSFAIQTLSQFLQQPRLHHYHALQQVMRYIIDIVCQGGHLQALDS
ncbi:uncharacterized protein LOC110704130 [Chenopodium quinoa]|uniref:uncharacterized protein LOC110704130 n=1 Tax=Chenopodium quinoa TaxID=63459 RepID=UPI000B76C084|nr:uncharacterized protein LOC110704130 [Chenopodium quinoa]